MKVLLANPLFTEDIGKNFERYYIRSGSRWPHSGIRKKGTLPHYLPFPFSLGFAAALLLREGFEVDVVDCVAAGLELEDFIAHVDEARPDIVFFETATPTIRMDIELARTLKNQTDALIVLGGTHATVFHQEMLRDESTIDIIVRGEFESSLLELIRCLENNGDPSSVRGITYRDGDEIRSTADAPPINPLDQLPPPARDLFPMADRPDPTIYWDGFCQKRPLVQMHASRGCPYSCDFCAWIQIMFQNGRYRMFSPQRVVDEMEDAVNRYGAREIYFDDDDFMINRNHVRAICEEIITRDLDVSWSVMGDAINLDEELVQLMARAGCIGLKFGVESGSPRMIRDLGKPVDLEKVRKVVSWCARNGVKTHATFSIGMYGDDLKSIRETLSYMAGLESDSIQVSVCVPFPGTRFYDKLNRESRIKEDWSRFDGKVSWMLRSTGLDPEDIEKMRQKAARQWLRNRLISPRWLARQIRYFSRLLRGAGLSFVIRQIYSILVDEKLLGSDA